jgi:hypothetical protein
VWFRGERKTVLSVILVVMYGGETLLSNATEEWDSDADWYN